MLLLALIASGPHNAAAAWGTTKEENKIALLWIPEMNSIDWEQLKNLIAGHPDASLTIALVPSEIPQQAYPWLAAWVREGRLEVALRIKGDPIMPLIYRYRNRDAIDQIALARIEYKKIFDRYPEGFVGGAGALTPELAKHLEAQKFKWSAVGDSAFRTPWHTAGPTPLIVIPFQAPISTFGASALADIEDYAVVLSELDGALSPGKGVDFLTMVLEDIRNDKWTSVSKSTIHFQPYAVGPELWPLFQGDIASWTGHPLQEKAWQLYAATVQALSDYQNSGTAKLNTLNRAAAHLYAAQNHTFYIEKNLSIGRIERNFRRSLTRVFQTINKVPPAALQKPIYAGSAQYQTDELKVESEELSQKPAELKEKDDETVIIEQTENSIFFENPQASTASLPVLMGELPPGTTPYNLWTPRTLRVTWDDESVSAAVSMRDILKRADRPNGFDGVMLELYFDLNNLAGRGATSLLPGRRGFVNTQDAWEYVVVIHSWGAGLYRALPGQPAALVDTLDAKTDLQTGEIRVSIPRKRLRGNPSGWGYILLALATDEGLARAKPPRALVGRNGSSLLGILGSVAQQRKLATSKSSYRRIGAVRLKDDTTPRR